MKILEYMERYEHEQLVYCCDPGAGLKAIIAIHDTTLGPALGGTRMWPYATEEEATLDVLRLARAMTYKAAAAGLSLGGGKAVVIGDPRRDKTEALFRSLGRYIRSLGGRYITTEDVGTTVADMELVSEETAHVMGLPLSQGGSGDPSPLTALGVLQAMKACAKEVFGADSLRRKIVALQGAGKVGYHLSRYLHNEGAKIVAADINPEATQRLREEVGATIVPPEQIYEIPCDIFSPCALGGVLDSQTIPRLKARIICGGANNQLLAETHGSELAGRGILYAPDYIANAGGIINLSFELPGYNPEAAREKVLQIYQTMQKVIALAKAKGITTAQAADFLAEERLKSLRKIRNLNK